MDPAATRSNSTPFAWRLAGASLVLIIAFVATSTTPAEESVTAFSQSEAASQETWRPAPILAPPPPPVEAEEDPTALSKPEAALQGSWYTTGWQGWQIDFKGHRFSARSGDTWYTGSFSAPASDDDPAPLDITIVDCNCKFKGQTSLSIYRWQGEGLKMSGTTPDTPRPRVFDDTLGLILDLSRGAGAKAP